MATRKSIVPVQVTRLREPRKVAAEKIQARIQVMIAADAEISSWDDLTRADEFLTRWDKYNGEMLAQMFTTDQIASEYRHAGWAGSISLGFHQPTLGDKVTNLTRDIAEKMSCLHSIIERLELIPIEPGGATSVQDVEHLRSMSGNRVFIVHGHDEGAKTATEAFLQRIGLEPVVLHRQPDGGATVIEKFEKYGGTDVDFALILLTPDEVSYLALDEAKDDGSRDKKKRARPNVIFEFGYFVGKLGRNRVLCLLSGGVEIPSDLSGLLYKEYVRSIDEIAWPMIQEFKAAGLEVRV